ncbi:MAG: site-2 protease family protein [Planctomycetota bacterium]|nr:site-2 protease family protein [Planctomycetota bacterium]
MGVCLMTGGTVLLAAESALPWILQPANWGVILQVAGGLGFVIFVHELGHFLVAKACGVKCEKFYLGFDIGGLKIASFKWGETEYGIGALPLGGYVKMLGQDDNPAAAVREAQRARQAEFSGDLPPEPTSDPHPAWDPRSYPAQSVPKRMAIISAGVIMNVIFAVLMAALAFALGVEEMTCEISSVRPGGAAWRAGLRTGDEITGIAGRTNPIFSDLRNGVTLGDVEKGVAFTIYRPADGSTESVVLHPDTDLGVPTVGVTSPFSITLPDTISPKLPGAAAEAEPPFVGGDAIRTVNGKPVASYAELITALARTPSEPVTLGVQRQADNADAGRALEIVLPPQPRRTLGIVMKAGPVKAVQAGSPAVAAGFRAGDRLVALNGEPITDVLGLDALLRHKVGESVKISVNRDGAEPATLSVVPREVTWIEEPRWPASPVAISSLGLAVAVETTIAAIDAGSPAEAAGVKAGEKVIRARFIEPRETANPEDAGLELSERSPSWPYWMAVLQQVAPETRVQLVVEGADGLARDVELDPAAEVDRFVVDRGLVFQPVYRLVKAGSVGAALASGSRKAIEDLSLVYRFLGKLTSSQISPRLLGGPIEIAKQAGRSAEEGFGRLLLFLTMLSANLAVVNFLPIPVLDGGHMVFLLYELVRGKPPSENVVAALSYLGLALILTLMMFVFGLDLGFIPRR